MRLFHLPINLLEEFNPQDEDFDELKAHADKAAADSILEAETTGKPTLTSKAAKWNKDWLVRVVCGIAYIFLRRNIMDYLNPAASRNGYKTVTDDEDLQKKYQAWLKFMEYEKG